MLTMNPNITFHLEWVEARRQVHRANEIAAKKGRKFTDFTTPEEQAHRTLARDMVEFQRSQFNRELEAA